MICIPGPLHFPHILRPNSCQLINWNESAHVEVQNSAGPGLTNTFVRDGGDSLTITLHMLN